MRCQWLLRYSQQGVRSLPPLASHLKLQSSHVSTSRYSSTFSTPSLPPNSVIFSGIQPTGTPHLGNYLGALQSWKQLQDGASAGTKLLFCIVDLHAITLPQEASVLRQRRREMLAAFLAVGLDPERSVLFYQSSVSRP
jgi:tryptophanyl-tRNA synthetase